MQYLKEDAGRLLATLIVAAAVIALGAWLENRTQLLHQAVTLSDNPISQNTPAPSPTK